MDSQALSADLLPDELGPILDGQALVRRWEVHPALDSTQRLARELAAGEEPGLLVLADEQSAGRGRQERRWFSPRGQGLWFSLVFPPVAPPERRPLLTSLASLAVRDALGARAGLRAGLKWPNDLVARGRKLAGVLADVERGGAVILGVGLNVAQRRSDFPSALRDQATSVVIETSQVLRRGPLLGEILGALEVWLGRFAAGEDESIRAALEAAAVLMGRRVRIAAGTDRISSGRVCGIGALGELILAPEPGASAEPRAVAGGTLVAIDPPLAQGEA